MQLSDVRVLVVDDEVALREMFAKWLRRSCAEVRTASDGDEAIAAVLEAPVDVLITDVRMPIMSGTELVRRLAAMGRLVPTIIFVSAFADVDYREMYDLGVQRFLAKPFKLEELSQALTEAIMHVPDKWKEAMAIPPRQSVRLELAAEPAGSKAGVSAVPGEDVQKQILFQLGRGGFSISSPQPLGLGKLAFDLTFTGSIQLNLVGEGFVRWRSRAEQKVGIELAFLEEPGRQWFVNQIAIIRPRSFIPAL